MSASVVWLREDLRLGDNAALTAAIAHGDAVVLVYVLDPGRPWAPGAASLWWLHHSLAALSAAVTQRGGQLVLRQGETEACLREVIEESGAGGAFVFSQLQPGR